MLFPLRVTTQGNPKRIFQIDGECITLSAHPTLIYEGDKVREFYSQLPRPVLVGIEAPGSMHWFLNLMDELGIECRVGHPATIRDAAHRKQKNDRRDAELILRLVAENCFRRSGCQRRSSSICGGREAGMRVVYKTEDTRLHRDVIR